MAWSSSGGSGACAPLEVPASHAPSLSPLPRVSAGRPTARTGCAPGLSLRRAVSDEACAFRGGRAPFPLPAPPPALAEGACVPFITEPLQQNRLLAKHRAPGCHRRVRCRVSPRRGKRLNSVCHVILSQLRRSHRTPEILPPHWLQRVAVAGGALSQHGRVSHLIGSACRCCCSGGRGSRGSGA